MEWDRLLLDCLVNIAPMMKAEQESQLHMASGLTVALSLNVYYLNINCWLKWLLSATLMLTKICNSVVNIIDVTMTLH